MKLITNMVHLHIVVVCLVWCLAGLLRCLNTPTLPKDIGGDDYENESVAPLHYHTLSQSEHSVCVLWCILSCTGRITPLLEVWNIFITQTGFHWSRGCSPCGDALENAVRYLKKQKQLCICFPSSTKGQLIARAIMREQKHNTEAVVMWGLNMEAFETLADSHCCRFSSKKLSFLLLLLSPPPTLFITVCRTNKQQPQHTPLIRARMNWPERYQKPKAQPLIDKLIKEMDLHGDARDMNIWCPSAEFTRENGINANGGWGDFILC